MSKILLLYFFPYINIILYLLKAKSFGVSLIEKIGSLFAKCQKWKNFPGKNCLKIYFHIFLKYTNISILVFLYILI